METNLVGGFSAAPSHAPAVKAGEDAEDVAALRARGGLLGLGGERGGT